MSVALLEELAAKPAFSWNGATGAFTDKDGARLSELRGYSKETVQYLRDNEIVGVVNGRCSFRTTYGAHVRRKDRSWYYEPRGQKISPFTLGQIEQRANVNCFESPWDAIALADSFTLTDKDAAFAKLKEVANERQ